MIHGINHLLLVQTQWDTGNTGTAVNVYHIKKVDNNLIEYSNNYSKTCGDFWKKYRDETYLNTADTLMNLIMTTVLFRLNLN